MRRVVVTGLGAVTPLGNDATATWEALTQGRSGIARITLFDPSQFEVQIGGEVKDFQPDGSIPAKELRRMDRNVQMGVVAALESVADAGLRVEASDGRRVGVVFASGIGGTGTILEQQKIMEERGLRRVSPFFIANMLADSASGHIAIMLGASGPNMAVVSSCSTGTGSIGEAMETIRRGDADAVVSGAAEATILPLFMAGFHAMRALAADNAEPHKACKPFDLRRDGFVVGEGAAALVLESLEHAQARGASIYAEVIGYGSSADAYDMVASDDAGRGPVNSMRLALEKAGIEREEVDYINAHGTGTPMNDRVETAAIKSVFGEHAYRLAVSSTKSMTGHLMGAAGAVEALATVLALHHQTIPPTINYEVPDPDCDLDYVPNAARPASLRVAMSNSIGLGGHCASILFRQYPS
jgi:3-oxoacyl-[acyl-carrier-protein] synthase II